MELKTKYSLENFIKDLLKKRFSKDREKQKPNFEDDKINLACPYCGDSEKKKSKKRGNIYLESNTFKCFNDGCMTYTPLDKFIAHFCHKYSLSPPDMFIDGKAKGKVRKIKKNALLEFLSQQSIKENLLTIKYFKDRFGFVSVGDLEPGDPVLEYIRGRRLDVIYNIGASCYTNSSRDRIYIVNLDESSGKILGFSERYIVDRNGPKYRIMSYSEINKDLVKVELGTEQIKDVDHLNNFFNVLNLDFSETITAVEGQFDSMFIRNCFAISGVTKGKTILEDFKKSTKVRVLFDNDKAGKTESMKLLEEGYHVFLWSKLIDDLKIKYNNELIRIKKIKDINDLYKFLDSVEKDYNVNKFNELIDGYFSDSMFDCISI